MSFRNVISSLIKIILALLIVVTQNDSTYAEDNDREKICKTITYDTQNHSSSETGFFNTNNQVYFPSDTACFSKEKGLSKTKESFEITCTGKKRVDCDPMKDGDWLCSSEQIGLYTPGNNAGTNGKNINGNKTGTYSSKKCYYTGGSGNESGVCSVNAIGYISARDEFKNQCAGFLRRDCDPIGGGQWTCSSQEIGSPSITPQNSGSENTSTGNGNGIIMLEAEETSSQLGLWKLNTDIPGYSGEGYLMFYGNSESNGPATSPLTYTFTPNLGGEYRLMMRLHRRPYPGRSDVSNDGFVKLSGDFSAGNGAPSKAQLQQNQKYYGGNTSWAWNPGAPLDMQHKKYKASYILKAGKTYTLTLSGRSKYWGVDRMVFAHSSISDNKAKNQIIPTAKISVPISTSTGKAETKTGLYNLGDLISLHYDFCPDPDDGHAVVSGKAVVDYYGLNNHVVMGTCGYDIKSRYDTKGYTVMDATYPNGYEDAMKDQDSAITNTAKKWIDTLKTGKKVFVAEGGQSDFTADVVRKVSALNSSINLKNIYVFQHSCCTSIAYNEKFTRKANLDYIKEKISYKAVANGNVGGNGSPDLGYIYSPSFITKAKNSDLGAQWKIAFTYLSPECSVQSYKCKLDFSDTVELLQITGDSALKDVNDFADKFLIKTIAPPAQQPADTNSDNGNDMGLYKKGDLISLHYDHAPDKDDGHAAAAGYSVVQQLNLNYIAVGGSYGDGNKHMYNKNSEAVMDAVFGRNNWSNAHKNWSLSVNNVAKKWKNTLLTGKKILVAEGGQSDFSADVLRSLSGDNDLKNINLKTHIIVVQHSHWNEGKANSSDLNYIKQNTTYARITDGNRSGNGTANLNMKSENFITKAKASSYSKGWEKAFQYLNPRSEKLDFSDTVELLHILGISTQEINNVDDFANTFLTNSPSSLSQTTQGDTNTSTENTCRAGTLSELKKCLQNPSDSIISLLSDISCHGENCCTGGTNIINFQNVKNLTIEGNGKTLMRHDKQRVCGLVNIANSTNITFQNITLDDDKNSPACSLENNCPRMLNIEKSNKIAFKNASIKNGKGYVVYIKQVNGFTFQNSSLVNSGVLGMYIGHGSNTPSQNIKISDSYFSDNSTNALALLGIIGDNIGSNLIENNIFERNHNVGQWPVQPQYGTGLTGGGQVYIADGNNITFKNNTIQDGVCRNCHISSTMGSGVSGLELGLPGKNSISNILIEANTILNNDAAAIYKNIGTQIGQDIIIKNNTLSGNGAGVQAEGALFIY